MLGHEGAHLLHGIHIGDIHANNHKKFLVQVEVTPAHPSAPAAHAPEIPVDILQYTLQYVPVATGPSEGNQRALGIDPRGSVSPEAAERYMCVVHRAGC